MPTPETTNRLVFIKYLYTIAKSQTSQPEPLNASAILTLHDTAELFLHLAAEQQGSTTERGFLGYWKTIKDNEGHPPTQHLAMERLNKARNALKHAGLRPSNDDVHILAAATTLFLAENAPTFFGISFDSIGLHQLLKHAQARQHLQTATNAHVGHQFPEVVTNLALAFNWLIDDYRDPIPSYSPERSRFLLSNRHRDLQQELRNQDSHQRLAAYVEHLTSMIGELYDTHTILSLGIKYPDYQRFRRLTPSVTRTTSEDPTRRYRVDIPIHFATYPYTEEELAFCTTFVVSTGLELEQRTPSPRNHRDS